jgi:hypothetical protein
MAKGSVLTVIAGGLAGLVVSMGVSRFDRSRAIHEKPPAKTGEEPELAAQTIAPVVTVALPQSNQGPRAAEGQGQGPAGAVSSAPPFVEESFEDSQKRHHDEHQKGLEAHAKEPVDRQWARATEESLERRLAETSSAAKFRLVDVNCRTTSCSATVEFESYGDAQRNWGRLLYITQDVKCGSRVWLDEPPNKTARFQTTALYDCERD